MLYSLHNKMFVPVTGNSFPVIYAGFLMYLGVLYVRSVLNIRDSILVQVLWIYLQVDEVWVSGAVYISSIFILENPLFYFIYLFFIIPPPLPNQAIQ